MTIVDNLSTNIPGYDRFIAFQKANIEAFLQSQTLFLGGLRTLSHEILSNIQDGLDDAAISVGNGLSGYQKLASNSAKLTNQSWKLVSDAMAPVAARLTDTVESLSEPQKEGMSVKTAKNGVVAKAMAAD
jgi:hypothetical protein